MWHFWPLFGGSYRASLKVNDCTAPSMCPITSPTKQQQQQKQLAAALGIYNTVVLKNYVHLGTCIIIVCDSL